MEKNERHYLSAPGRLFSTLRSRLLALVLLASIPAFALIIYNNIEQRRHDVSDAQTEALSVVRQVAHEQMEIIRDTSSFLSVVEHAIDLDDGQAMSRLFAELMREHGTYSNIGFIGPDGFLISSALPFKSPLYVGDRSYFKEAVEGLKFSVSGYQIGRVSQTPVITMAHPIIKKGTFKGALVAALPITEIEKRLSKIPLQRGQTIILADTNGTLLAMHPLEKKWIAKNLHETEHESILRQDVDEGFSSHKGHDGRTRVYAFIRHKFSESGRIYVISGIPADQVYAKADSLLLRNVLTSIGITTLVLLLAWLASEKLVLQSVRELVAVTRELGGGNRKSRARFNSGTFEMDYLSRSVNEMADLLEARAEEAERHLARIASLNRIYAVLSAINGVIIRSIGEEELLKEACRISVEHGSFTLAWAALADESGRLHAAAWAGSDKDYVDRLMMEFMSPDAEPKPMALRAFLENREVVAVDFEKDMELAPWRDLAAQYGYRSVAAFPLRVEGKPVGALSLYYSEPGFFDDKEELRLLLELASDTSLGLEKIKKEQHIEFLSRYDVLTGLVNRWVFEDHLNNALTRAKYSQRNVAVLMLDIKDFSRINDTLGHSAGDAVLKALARYLSGSVRDGDTVARLGNDNFGVILQDLADREDAVSVVGKIMDDLPSTINFGSEHIFVNTYSGIAIYPDDGTTPQELMQNTELAMHASDASGKGQPLYYSQEMNIKAREQRSIENELRHALEKKEFELVYQPIVAVEDRRIIAVEALLRWTSQKLGPVPPDKFIPVAEKTGLIVPIGEWVLKTAVAQAREWEKRGVHDLRVGVNVSVRQLREPDFCERLKRILGYGFASRSVKIAIEVTESELMKNMEIFVKTLDTARSFGIHIYIDDFGTGYSSLSYLKSLPADTLKIDRTFIKDLATDSSSLSMAMGIIAIANSLGLDVVAEGVEKEEQLVILDDLGCGAAQGYLFSRPLPVKLIEPLLLSRA